MQQSIGDWAKSKFSELGFEAEMTWGDGWGSADTFLELDSMVHPVGHVRELELRGFRNLVEL